MEKIINTERMRSLLSKDSSARVSDFEIYLIQEGVKQILINNKINDAMLKFLEDNEIVKKNATIKLLNDSSKEKQRELKKLLKIPRITKVWDYSGLISNSNFFGTQKDWNQSLAFRINEVSAYIHERTGNSGCNIMIVHPSVTPIIDYLEYYKSYGTIYDNCEPIGEFGSRYLVFCSMEIVDRDEILLIKKESDESLEDSFKKGDYGIIKILNNCCYVTSGPTKEILDLNNHQKGGLVTVNNIKLNFEFDEENKNKYSSLNFIGSSDVYFSCGTKGQSDYKFKKVYTAGKPLSWYNQDRAIKNNEISLIIDFRPKEYNEDIYLIDTFLLDSNGVEIKNFYITPQC